MNNFKVGDRVHVADCYKPAVESSPVNSSLIGHIVEILEGPRARIRVRFMDNTKCFDEFFYPDWSGDVYPYPLIKD